MKALKKQAMRLFDRVRVQPPQPAEPEPVYADRRPVTGLFNSLTPEQKKKVLEYRGPEDHGDAAFRLRKVHA